MTEQDNNVNRIYTTSISEITRRKKAFIALLVSLFVSMEIFIIDFTLKYPIIILIISTVIILLFLLVVNKLFKTFKYQLKMHLYFNGNLILCYYNNEKVLKAEDIQGIRVKRTSYGAIREIMVRTKNGDISINGMNDFEELYNDLILFLNKETSIIYFKEKINFDHPMFYPIFGVITSAFFIGLLRLLFLFKDNIYIFQIIVSLFVISLSIHWIIKKPLSRSYGDKSKKKDYIISLILFLSGLIIIFLIFINNH